MWPAILPPGRVFILGHLEIKPYTVAALSILLETSTQNVEPKLKALVKAKLAIRAKSTKKILVNGVTKFSYIYSITAEGKKYMEESRSSSKVQRKAAGNVEDISLAPYEAGWKVPRIPLQAGGIDMDICKAPRQIPKTVV